MICEKCNKKVKDKDIIFIDSCARHKGKCLGKIKKEFIFKSGEQEVFI